MKLNRNTKVTNLRNHKDAISNVEGGLSFKLPIKERLVNRTLTCLFNENKFYGKQDVEIIADIEECSKSDPSFILKLAIFARNVMYLRTVPQVILVECANSKYFKNLGLVRPATNKIIMRADEIMEVLAYQLQTYKKPIPIALKRGLRDTFGKFDSYQLSKYDRDGEVKLVDALNLIRPIPRTEEQKILYKKIVENKLESPETWEVILGNWKSKDFENKTKAWEYIIEKIWCVNGQVKNYFALIRNLRNILEADVSSKHFNLVCEAIKNEQAVKNSKMYPFRFYSAYREIEVNNKSKAHKILEAVETALSLSIGNLPKLNGMTMYSSDNSGSMDSALSDKSRMTFKEIANLMQAIGIVMSDDYICSVFGESFATVNITKKQSVFDRMNKLRDTNVGYSTNGYFVLDYLNKSKTKVDRIIIFTDEQMYDDSGYDNSFIENFKKYKKVNPNVFLYVVNLNGYGNSIVPKDESNVALISGWSEKILDYIVLFEKGKQTLVKEIDEIRI